MLDAVLYISLLSKMHDVCTVRTAWGLDITTVTYIFRIHCLLFYDFYEQYMRDLCATLFCCHLRCGGILGNTTSILVQFY